ncbi:MAG: long-chain fatty acid--CoA ligase [Caldilineaceae bacterium]
MSDFPWYAKYEKSVPKTIQVKDMPLHQLLSDAAQKYPSNIALRLVLKYLPAGLKIQSRMTYAELNAASDRFAAALQGIGIKKGDRIALMTPNLPQQVVAYFGALKAGATVVNTNPTYTATELKHLLHDSGAETMVMLTGLYSRLEEIRSETPVKNVILIDIPETLSFPFKGIVEKQVRQSGMMKDIAPGPGIYRYSELIRQARPKPTPVAIQADDVVLFQYTGGTTGTPKAAMLTHRNLVANFQQCEAWFTGIEYGREKVLFSLPSFHVYGMTVAMILALGIGAELVIVPDPRNTTHVLQVLHNEKITLWPGVPSMYNAIINHKEISKFDLHSVKACLSGAMALPVEVAEKFMKLTGGSLREGFGMTETSPVLCANPIYGEARVGSIGLPLSSTEVRLVKLEPDADGKYQEVGEGEEGELCARGPQIMKGYWNKPDETANTIDSEGWLHTGDIAKMDADGYFYIVDRKKDMINIGGFKVFPRDVEEALFRYDKVMDAAVAGIVDAKQREAVKAYIVLKEGQSCNEEEIVEFCRSQLAPYKVPTAVEFRKDLPKSQVGKVLRRELVREEKERMAKAKLNK